MSNLREAAAAALEALEWLKDRGIFGDFHGVVDNLRAALAEPAQEPVAWMVYTLDGKSVCVTDNPADFTERHKVLPLYTSDPIYTNPAPQRKPLSDEDLMAAWRTVCERNVTTDELVKTFARVVEFAHGIKGEKK